MREADLIDSLSRRIPHLIRQQRIPGLSVAVGRGGRVVWAQGFGHADLAGGVPMGPDTVFPSGSMGKVITATAVMQLVERGIVDLDQPVDRHLDFPVSNPLGERAVTVRDLLTHRSGLTQNGASCTLATPPALGDHLRQSFAQPVQEYYHGGLPKWFARVGEATQYSNTGMATLGYLVERANPEGLSFSEQVQENVIDVAGMSSTQFPPVQDAAHVRAEIWDRRTTGYASFGGLHVPTPIIHFADYPAGLAMTTASDLARLVMAHLGDGALEGRRILDAATAQRMRRNETGGTRPHHGMDFGLMWMLGDEARPRFIAHGGAHMYGYSGWLCGYPDLDLCVVVLTNQWPMTEWEPDGVSVGARLDLPAFAAARLDGAAAPGPGLPAMPWAWKASYLAGLLLGERTWGLMGVRERLEPAALDAMIAGASADGGSGWLWDADGFRAGMTDLGEADHTHAGITAFMRSEHMRLPADELDLLYRDLGGSGRPVMPLGEPRPAPDGDAAVPA